MNKTQDDAALIVKRVFPYSREILFRAFSDPETMNKWFHSDPGWAVEVRNDFRLGGEYAVVMKPPQGAAIPHTGVYKEIVPGEKIVFTWNSPFVRDSLVTLSFSPAASGTELNLLHEFLGESLEAHRGGWTGCLDSLSRYLAAPPILSGKA